MPTEMLPIHLVGIRNITSVSTCHLRAMYNSPEKIAAWSAVGDRHQPLEDDVVCNLCSYCLCGVNRHYLHYSVLQHVGAVEWLISGPLLGISIMFE